MNFQVFTFVFALKVLVFNYYFVFAEFSEEKRSIESLGNEREDLFVGNIRQKRENVNQVHVHVHINNGNNKEDDVDKNSVKQGDLDQDLDADIDDKERKRNRRRRKKMNRKCKKQDKRKKCRRHRMTTPSTLMNTTQTKANGTDQSVEASNYSQTSNGIELTTTDESVTAGTVPPTQPVLNSDPPIDDTTDTTTESPSETPLSQSLPYFPPTEMSTNSVNDNMMSDKDIQMRKPVEDEKHIVRDV